MVSFYGSLGGSGNSGEGVSNYDKLSNKPIEILIGSEEKPINLEDLDYGVYLLTGQYKTSSTAEVKSMDSKRIILEIFRDSSNLSKVIKYDVYIDGVYSIASIIYFTDGKITENIQPISGGSGEGTKQILFFETESLLPSIGNSDYLYVTKDTDVIFRWDDSASQYKTIKDTTSNTWGVI